MKQDHNESHLVEAMRSFQPSSREPSRRARRRAARWRTFSVFLASNIRAAARCRGAPRVIELHDVGVSPRCRPQRRNEPGAADRPCAFVRTGVSGERQAQATSPRARRGWRAPSWVVRNHGGTREVAELNHITFERICRNCRRFRAPVNRTWLQSARLYALAWRSPGESRANHFGGTDRLPSQPNGYANLAPRWLRPRQQTSLTSGRRRNCQRSQGSARPRCCRPKSESRSGERRRAPRGHGAGPKSGL